MLKNKVKRRVFAAAVAVTSIVGFSMTSMADGHKVVDLSLFNSWWCRWWMGWHCPWNR